MEITDLAVAVGLPLLTAVSWLLPQSAWRGFCRACVPFYGPGQSGQPSTPSVYRRVEEFLGARATSNVAEAVVGEAIEEDILSLVELLRVYGPGGWNPTIDLIGGDHVASALARGRGAILWVGHFVHGDLVAKMAFDRAAMAVSHLSHPSHGFSSSRFGVSCLNRVKTAAEDRYLASRVSLDRGRPGTAMKVLRGCLRENRVVSISVRGAARNSRSVAFLDGEINIAVTRPGSPGLPGHHCCRYSRCATRRVGSRFMWNLRSTRIMPKPPMPSGSNTMCGRIPDNGLAGFIYEDLRRHRAWPSTCCQATRPGTLTSSSRTLVARDRPSMMSGG